MRVLIVEDEVDLANVLRQALEEEGFVCDVALDGVDGLFNAESWDYDAIVLDLMLPELDGREVLTKLREQKTTPVLILTARDALGDKVDLLDRGADDYLTKPFALEELIARLRALVRRAVHHPRPVIELGEVEIDTVARVLRLSGELVTMSPKEFALVELLALHQGELMTRSQIYEHLYGEDDATLSNVVDVFVSRIRKKLGHGFVRTRRGEGYVIDAE